MQISEAYQNWVLSSCSILNTGPFSLSDRLDSLPSPSLTNHLSLTSDPEKGGVQRGISADRFMTKVDAELR